MLTEHADHLCIEFIHFMLFVGMMYYVIFVAIICRVLDRKTRHWARWEKTPLDFHLVPDDVKAISLVDYLCNKKKRKLYHHYRYQVIEKEFRKQHGRTIANLSQREATEGARSNEGDKKDMPDSHMKTKTNARLTEKSLETSTGTGAQELQRQSQLKRSNEQYDVQHEDSYKPALQFRFYIYLQHGLEHVLCEICEVGWRVWLLLLVFVGLLTTYWIARYGNMTMEGKLLDEPVPWYHVDSVAHPEDAIHSRKEMTKTKKEMQPVRDNEDFLSMLFVIAYSTMGLLVLVRWLLFRLGRRLLAQLDRDHPKPRESMISSVSGTSSANDHTNSSISTPASSPASSGGGRGWLGNGSSKAQQGKRKGRGKGKAKGMSVTLEEPLIDSGDGHSDDDEGTRSLHAGGHGAITDSGTNTAVAATHATAANEYTGADDADAYIDRQILESRLHISESLLSLDADTNDDGGGGDDDRNAHSFELEPCGGGGGGDSNGNNRCNEEDDEEDEEHPSKSHFQSFETHRHPYVRAFPLGLPNILMWALQVAMMICGW